MSTENVTLFLNRLRTDEALAAKVKALSTESGDQVAQDLSRLATETGLPFTSEEFIATQGHDLTDADLEQIAGGFSFSDLFKKLAPTVPSIVNRS